MEVEAPASNKQIKRYTTLCKWVDENFDDIFSKAPKGKDYAIVSLYKNQNEPQIDYFSNITQTIKAMRKNLLSKVLYRDAKEKYFLPSF